MSPLPTRPDEYEDPSHSSAASCISLSIVGESFHPVFTHQCFPGECIPGYQPKAAAPVEVDPQSSHHRHPGHIEMHSNHNLQVHVTLAPSCRSCCVNVQVSALPDQPLASPLEGPSKRPRHCQEDDYNEENRDNRTNGNGKQDEPEPNSDYSIAPSPPRMLVAEILDRLQTALPTMHVDNNVTQDYLHEPVGTILQEYRQNEHDFVLCLAKGSEVGAYHSQVQKLAVWFIETADSVDITSGQWKVLYILRKHDSQEYSLAGYCTLYSFLSPFKKPKAGTVVRICQALLFPPYQRAGHGHKMLHAIHDLMDKDDSVVEINVEDPAPAFVQLRNRVDYERFCQSLLSCGSKSWLPERYWKSTTLDSDNFFLPVSEADAITAGTFAKVTPRQVQIAHELYKLSCLVPPAEVNYVDWEKRYRLMVKHRLVKVHREELGGCHTKGEKQALLGKLFDDTYAQYMVTLRRKT